MQDTEGPRMRSGTGRQHSQEIREEFNVLREDGADGIRPFVPSGKHKIIYLAIVVADQVVSNLREGSGSIDGRRPARDIDHQLMQDAPRIPVRGPLPVAEVGRWGSSQGAKLVYSSWYWVKPCDERQVDAVGNEPAVTADEAAISRVAGVAGVSGIACVARIPCVACHDISPTLEGGSPRYTSLG